MHDPTEKNYMAGWPFTPRHLVRLQEAKVNPWGLPLELLGKGKVVTDPVHGDIHLTRLEMMFVDSPPLQRLRRVRQLGTTRVVYPGAVHTRFEHVLGTLRAAQDLFDAAYVGDGPGSEGLFTEWRLEGRVDEKVAEAQVLLRLGALLHDLGHIPYGHTLEDELGILSRHDSPRSEGRFHRLWDQIPDETRRLISPQLKEELTHMALSSTSDTETKEGANQGGFRSQYPFVHDMVGNTICADLIDYLQRDHLYTGLPLALGTRFISGVRVLGSEHPRFPQRVAFDLDRDGMVRHDVVTEILKYLRYRYELSERVLYHHSKLAADAMLAKVFGLWTTALLESSDPGDPASIIEAEMVLRSDDGILEYLRSVDIPDTDTDIVTAMNHLAEGLLNRQLYKWVAMSADRSTAEEVFDHLQNVTERLRIERDAATFIGCDESEIAVFVPPPAMRLKAADVLVHRNGVVSKLSSNPNLAPGAQRIYENHHNLWRLAVYAAPQLADDPIVPGVLALWFQQRLGIPMHNRQGEQRPSIVSYAIRSAAPRLGMDRARYIEAEVGQAAAASGPMTFSQLCAMVRAEVDKGTGRSKTSSK